MSYALKKQEGTEAQYTTNYRRIARHLQPILDSTKDLTEKDSLDIFKNCGKENICIPDLKVEADTTVKTFLLGSCEQFKLHVHIHNKGDDAFETTYYLKIPLGLSYININRTEEENRSGGVPVLCMPPANQSLNILKCDIGNPLPKNKHVGFTVLMQPFYTEGLRSQYEFSMLVNSTNPENVSTQFDNILDIVVPISIQTDFNIVGASEPHEVYWSAANYTKEKFTHEGDIGPPLTYIHAILNKGPADIVEANVFFMLPNETLAGDTILYLLEQPGTSGPIRCEEVDANPLKLALSSNNRVVRTSSLMAFEVTTLPYIGAPREPMIRGNEIFTDINLTDSPAKPEVVPLWVVVLSAVAGAIILLLIIYLLWMRGFFKRNRPSDAAEKEPLNRNGHYLAGDEAL